MPDEVQQQWSAAQWDISCAFTRKLEDRYLRDILRTDMSQCILPYFNFQIPFQRQFIVNLI